MLCSDVDARRDTVYVKQKALVDAKIEFAKRFFASLNKKASNGPVTYGVVDSFDALLQLVGE